MYELLLSAGRIGRLVLPNRVIMGSLHLGFENFPKGAEYLASFYAERAKGRVGLIITGGSAVTPEGASDLQFSRIWDSTESDKFVRITTAVHQAGGRIALQLFHAGRYAREDKTGLQPVAPSAVPTRMSPTLARELREDEVEAIIEAFGRGAALAKEYGFDAVEIMGSEGYLINQFLSPVTNRREDGWGGTFEKRARFGLEVARSVRRCAGEDFPVIFRMSGLDLIPDSTTWEETVRFARLLEENGVDALNIGIGWHESAIPTVQAHVPHAAFAHVAGEIKRAVSIPVVVSNRINRPELANRLLAEGVADFVSMARPFLADPHFVRKVEEGRPESINTCIACNQACLDKTFTHRPVSCLVNPQAGRESLLPVVRTENPMRVAVVGGGPAGMEACRVLALRGHRVTLFEKERSLGGQFRWAGRVPGKGDFVRTIEYYSHELNRLGVDVRLHTAVSGSVLQSFDACVLATGVVPRSVSMPGSDLPHVCYYTDYFEDRAVVGEKVVVIGAGGIALDVALRLTEGKISPEVALFLLEQAVEDVSSISERLRPRRKVTLLRRGRRVAEHVGRTTRWVVLNELARRGVDIRTEIRYKAIVPGGVEIEEKGKSVVLPADSVIIAAGQESNRTLLEELTALGFIRLQIPDAQTWLNGERLEPLVPSLPPVQEGKPLFVIGGANDPEALDAERAILEGTLAGRLI
ncbi:NADPH-dependent 2,4-dienoyl-CoA reductase [Kyrpidia tusciae]|uniref:NADH:flavin oxidoreductase/NADH oxidase n=1 Tax=Kyrpidia tusciae (strain DSM 2912 / NBRC 15312 / T2) TaxID=562970 RepID=D5WXT9_KYRT2|nr:NADPH-dependent 2,4-dienoyl-CoA reductase [Kyrpidia tusciae]ADG05998.1 NADH:flavin oxidoreductase/NADH oxidase [Kyrpidia tusciae DSM 2912]